ncbi:zinc finger BED domain-containing protein RICESLEEPER 2-like [Apium graveolens]|uniref:zinc finger BED domain-containing protein RICESLEEPER 2-like n=1 Tax=Apium graveolens TaxID=4045 RepID=UPI003D78BE6E
MERRLVHHSRGRSRHEQEQIWELDYESLSDDEGDKHDEDKDDEATDPTDPTNPTEGSSKPGQKRKGTRKRRSKAWDTFDELPIGEDKKVCLSTGDVRQMILSSSQGSIALRNTSFDPKNFRDMITSIVVRHNPPLSFVEYEGIRDAFLYANPKATLVSRNTLKSDIIALYKYEKKQLFNMFKNYDGRVRLTSDLWTSVATDGYITITAHYITDDWVLHKKLLNFSYMPAPHTGITIADKIYKLLCEWNLEFKLFSITLDNASSLKDMDDSVVKVRESVKYIKGSPGRKENFIECIEQVALSRSKGLRQDVPTRWNSTYIMLDSALYYRRAFSHLKLSDSNYKHDLDDEEWDKMEGI